MASTPPRAVLAAGVVAFRAGRQVLVVHRPRYDDWSFPKGKVDPGEHVTATAVRETWEETGLHVRLGPQLADQRYAIAGGRPKVVSYWTGRAVGDDDVATYAANREIDEVAWVDLDKAEGLLTYPHDRTTLAQATGLRRRTAPIVVLRHGKARSRKAWRKDDRQRPLLALGTLQAERLVPVLSAYAVTRVVTSSSTRCLQTVTPFADTTGWEVEATDGLSEEGHTKGSVRRVVAAAREAAADGVGTVLCSHRPVLPQLLRELGLKDPQLAPGQLLVAHTRKGDVVAHEVHGVG